MTATTRDLTREMEAASILREQLATLAASDEDLARDMIEGETNLIEVISSLVAHEGEDRALLSGLDKFAEELDGRRDRIKGRIETRRALLGAALEMAGVKNLETPTGTVSLTKIAPKPIITEEADIPARFWMPVAPRLDKKALSDAMKAGESIPGATMSNGGLTVSIRRS